MSSSAVKKLSRRTAKLLGDIYYAAFTRMVQMGYGKDLILERDLLRQFLYEEGFDAWIMNKMDFAGNALSPNLLREFIMRLHTGESAVVDRSDTMTLEQGQEQGQRYLKHLAEAIIGVFRNDEKTAELAGSLVASLQADGLAIGTDGRICAAEQPYLGGTGIREPAAEAESQFASKDSRILTIPEHGQYELMSALVGFKPRIEERLTRFPFDKNVFLMMKFRDSNKDLSEFILENLASHGLTGVRADQPEWSITRNVYNPIAVLYCCKYGVALFDEPEENQAYSPNVVYELAIMHYQNKQCLILKHASLPPVPFDLVKDLYESYSKDLQVKRIVARWIREISSG